MIKSKHDTGKTTVANINSLLSSGEDPERLVHILADPQLDLPPVFTQAPLVHYKELSAARNNKDAVSRLSILLVPILLVVGKPIPSVYNQSGVSVSCKSGWSIHITFS